MTAPTGKRRRWTTRRIARNTFRLALLLSLPIWIAVYIGGFHVAPENLPPDLEYKAWFQELNWWPLPLFVIAIWRLVDRSWNPFIQAWLKSWEVVRRDGGAGVSPEERQAVIDEMRSWRKYLLIAAWLSAIVWGASALRPLWTIYTTDSAAEQIRLAVDSEPRWTARFVFAGDRETGYRRTRLALEAESPAGLASLATEPAWRADPVQIALTALTALQLLFVVAMAFFALYQVLAQAAFFAFVDRLAGAKRSGITLWLKHDDKLREFGLHQFNRALCSLYSAIAVCLVIAVIYRAESAAASNLVLAGNLLAAFIPLAPLLLTLLARRRWTEPCRRRAAQDLPDGPRHFVEQRLWPISTHRPRIAGLSLAIALTGYLVGSRLLDFLS